MKIQAILFTLIQTQAVLCSGSTRGQTMNENYIRLNSYEHMNEVDCSAPCKTQLRLSASKTKKCLETNCGSYGTQSGFNGNEGADNVGDFPGNQNACVSHCKKLRFGPERQASCIADCDQDGSLNERANFDADKERDNNFSGNQNSCVSRCKRLRFSPERHASCVSD